MSAVRQPDTGEHTEEYYRPSPEDAEHFAENGYVVVKGLLQSSEVQKLQRAVDMEDGVRQFACELDDGADRKTKVCLWNRASSDFFGLLARCERLAGVMEAFLGGEVYHYHTKLIMKEAHTGGQFVWHQDYGYWYNNGCLYPNMGSVMVAIDKCDKSNGCLQVLRGSHKAGRINHITVGEMTGADLDRVAMLQQHPDFPTDYVELQPGDALFFHCNLLHRSDKNDSPHRRYCFLTSYNRADNNPVIKHHHPQYHPLNKVPDTAVTECTDLVGNLGDKDFMQETKVVDGELVQNSATYDHSKG